MSFVSRQSAQQMIRKSRFIIIIRRNATHCISPNAIVVCVCVSVCVCVCVC